VIESMTGARFIHDTLERFGWEVEIADAQKVKGLAPLAVKTDRIDARVLAVLSHRDLVPAIWLPDPRVRGERELARFRLHLVKHRSQLKHRIHSALMAFGRPRPVTDLFGIAGRRLLASPELPEPWRGNIEASLVLIDSLESQVDEIDAKLRASRCSVGAQADGDLEVDRVGGRVGQSAVRDEVVGLDRETDLFSELVDRRLREASADLGGAGGKTPVPVVAPLGNQDATVRTNASPSGLVPRLRRLEAKPG
jgi:hypothetical protein